HELFVRGVGHVELEDRELGVVARADAFVAEGAAELVDAIEAAHEEALEIELGRDAQVELEVERVVVRAEGLGRGAAADGVEERGLHLEEAALVEEAAEGLHDGGARSEGLGDLGVREEIDVTLAVALLDVLEAVPL